MIDLATIARNVGNLTEAQNQLRRAYGIVVSSAGPEHPTALSVEGRLAAVTYRLGEPTEAYDWHLADVGRRVLRDDHPAVKGAEQRLAARPIAMPVVDPIPEAMPGRIPDRDEPDEPENNPGYPPTYAPHAPGVYQRQPEPQDIYIVTAPPRVYTDVERLREPPLVAARVPSRRAHRGGLTLVMSLGAAVLIAATVIIATQIVRPGRDASPSAATLSTANSPSQPAPTSPGPRAPIAVKLRDNGGSITLTWSDPSGGLVPFIVTGGRIGQPSRPYETVPAGRTNWTVYGLNNTFNYCFTVAAVWSTNSIASSDSLCTDRLSTATPR